MTEGVDPGQEGEGERASPREAKHTQSSYSVVLCLTNRITLLVFFRSVMGKQLVVSGVVLSSPSLE